ncbi:MAG: hypothetical protein NZ902_04710 [Acidilobaceae archaeon]|nr:hypothetical protein [Acidilobaceae archaeon]MCX8165870.1 hypothetical protein [Acidilobaceae archaeon]MDW7974512.1 hypothetical protein [Sulfolobales archaeon]
MVKGLNKYKALVETLGLRQVDVYRSREGGREKEVVRLYDPTSGKVIVVDLGTVRESLTLEEYLNRVLEASGKHGVRVSDKKLQVVRSQVQRERPSSS